MEGVTRPPKKSGLSLFLIQEQQHLINAPLDLDSTDKIAELLRKLVKDRFFGEVAITFQSGRPHTIKVNRTYKVEQL